MNYEYLQTVTVTVPQTQRARCSQLHGDCRYYQTMPGITRPCQISLGPARCRHVGNRDCGKVNTVRQGQISPDPARYYQTHAKYRRELLIFTNGQGHCPTDSLSLV